MDLLDFVDSMGDEKKKKEKEENREDEKESKDDVDNSPKLAIDPELSISNLKLTLTFDVNSDLHDLMKRLNVVRNRYRVLEPVVAVMNLFGDMIGHIDGAELDLARFEKRKCVMSTKQITKSITKHYGDEFGSPSKWLAIAKRCGAIGAVSVRDIRLNTHTTTWISTTRTMTWISTTRTITHKRIIGTYWCS